jgi:hypothetical protein
VRDDDPVNEKVKAHATVRHEPWAEDVTLGISVVAIVPTKAEADAEVARLTKVNEGKDCAYFTTPTRYYPAGRGVE